MNVELCQPRPFAPIAIAPPILTSVVPPARPLKDPMDSASQIEPTGTYDGVVAFPTMSRLTLPQGQSLRQVAERLGVPVDELLRHSGLKDAEAPLAVARAIEVPDGFLKSRARQADMKDAVTTRSGKQAGMNMWL